MSISISKFIICGGALSLMIIMLLYIQTLRNNVHVLKQEVSTKDTLIELKNNSIVRLELQLKLTSKLLKIREDDFVKIENKLNNAKSLLEQVKDESNVCFSDNACSVLNSLGILHDTDKNTDSNAIPADTSSADTSATQRGTDNAR